MEVRLSEDARQRVKHGLASAQQALGAAVLRLRIIRIKLEPHAEVGQWAEHEISNAR